MRSRAHCGLYKMVMSSSEDERHDQSPSRPIGTRVVVLPSVVAICSGCGYFGWLHNRADNTTNNISNSSYPLVKAPTTHHTAPANERLPEALRLRLYCHVSSRLVHEAVRFIRHGCRRVKVRQTNQLVSMANALEMEKGQRARGWGETGGDKLGGRERAHGEELTPPAQDSSQPTTRAARRARRTDKSTKSGVRKTRAWRVSLRKRLLGLEVKPSG